MFEDLVHISPDAVIIADLSGTIMDASRQTLHLCGYKEKNELTGKSFFDIIAPESKAKAIIYLNKTLKEGITNKLEYTLLKKNGESFIGEISIVAVNGTNENETVFVAILRDVTDHKSAQDQLKKSIKEKESLLQEIHHRVKNNLQVISSILDMSRMRTNDSQANSLIKDAQSKIQTMAFIHSQLYRSERFDQIRMQDHINELVQYLRSVYTDQKNITCHLDISDVNLPLTQAIPCALVLNELISNAFKHAFKHRKHGTVEVTMNIFAEQVFLTVRDDGIGVSDGVNIYQTQSLGMKLVRNLVQKQLKGKFKMIRKKYTEFNIEFPALSQEGNDDKHHGG
ncbi:MAG: PAS domain S-box protein [Candidatus Aminicenantes bacterium]|nr:PAS domain S-box protein [Candidatus Aminicenantes bacterium]